MLVLPQTSFLLTLPLDFYCPVPHRDSVHAGGVTASMLKSAAPFEFWARFENCCNDAVSWT